MKKMILPAIAALGLSTAAFAEDNDYGGNWQHSAGFEYGAGGEGINLGNALGDLSVTWSNTNKHIYGGGDAAAGPLGAGASAYAGSHFETMGGALAIDAGHGDSAAGTSEEGMVAGGGFVVVGGDWSHGDDD